MWPLPQGNWVVSAQPAQVTANFLWERWHAASWRALADRRQDFQGIRPWVDPIATLGIFKGMAPDKAGILRCVMAGDLALENQAKHWERGRRHLSLVP